MTISTNTLGRTGLRVTRLGLGCGGPSRLGLKHGATRDDAVRVIRYAIDRGINFLDTAQEYTTESDVARAIAESGRDGIIVSTKVSIICRNGRDVISAAELVEKIEQSLAALKTDRLDILHLHGVEPAEYPLAAKMHIEELLRQRDKGKIRFIGITENFNTDFRHGMLTQALEHDCWDVVMVGFNYINHTAREAVLTSLKKKNVGVIGMFAVRRALAVPEQLGQRLSELLAQGKIDAGAVDPTNPMAFAMGKDKAESLTDLAYRYAIHEPGIHTVLAGTGNTHHLDENIASARRGPLPADLVDQLNGIFGRVDCFAGN